MELLQEDVGEMMKNDQDANVHDHDTRIEQAETRTEQTETQIEQALHTSEVSYRRLFEAAKDGILILDADTGCINDVNPFLSNLLGFSRSEMVGKTVGELSPFKDIESNQVMLERLQQHGYVRYEDLPLETRDGRKIAVEFVSNVYQDGDKKVIQCNVRDITERKRMEEQRVVERRRLEAQFIEAQKMEVIGQLASGVAHDFNNILGVIMGYSDMIMSELGPDGPLREYTEEIRHASERAAGLTQQLLIFSRKQTVQPVVLNLNDVVKGLDKMLRRLIGDNIEMTIVPGKQIGCIKADSGHVGQVLMNLVVNARDAMPNGGKLTIATNNVTLDGNCPPCGAGGGTSPGQVLPVRLPPLTHGAGSSTPQDKRTHADATPGEYVMLSVSDTGTGMTGEVKARLFEAFFTTKPSGKGTGLGLATCQTIVQQSGGHIGVYSEVGRGTAFKVYFPRVDQSLDASAQVVKAGPLPRGTETLLVVEDEPSVRHLVTDMLEAQGYNVLRANNGQDALRVAGEHKGAPIRLVVTDVIMPLMGGKVMAEWLKTTYPDLKILFTSGYTEDAMTRRGMIEAEVEFLSKPYAPATLVRKVRKMLDKSD